MIDANLNFPIARPQVLVVLSLVIATSLSYYIKIFKRDKKKFKLFHFFRINYCFTTTVNLYPIWYTNL